MRRRDVSAIVLSVCTLLLTAGCAGPRPAGTPAPAPPAGEGIRPRIGLALGGGGARGFAHIGALRVLEQEKIPIDLVVGTSVGSLVGALYADQGRVLDAEMTALTVGEEELFDQTMIPLFSGGLVKGKKLEAFLRDNLKHPLIEDMVVPFAAVAVDLDSGETVVFRSGPVAPAVHASCAIPGVFVPVTIGGRTFVDGGVTNPVPASVARALGAEVVIAMSVPPPAPKPAARNQLSVTYHAISIMAAEIGRLRAGEADVVIAAEVGKVDFDDFSQKRRLIEAGEAAARAALPAIRAAIAAKTRY
ncbi:MAG: patatin-like phospholipase family protein [Candidatus Krumholzibacteriia bacterium]